MRPLHEQSHKFSQSWLLLISIIGGPLWTTQNSTQFSMSAWQKPNELGFAFIRIWIPPDCLLTPTAKTLEFRKAQGSYFLVNQN